MVKRDGGPVTDLTLKNSARQIVDGPTLNVAEVF
jgi:hypothetical protein